MPCPAIFGHLHHLQGLALFESVNIDELDDESSFDRPETSRDIQRSKVIQSAATLFSDLSAIIRVINLFNPYSY